VEPNAPHTRLIGVMPSPLRSFTYSLLRSSNSFCALTSQRALAHGIPGACLSCAALQIDHSMEIVMSKATVTLATALCVVLFSAPTWARHEHHHHHGEDAAHHMDRDGDHDGDRGHHQDGGSGQSGGTTGSAGGGTSGSAGGGTSAGGTTGGSTGGTSSGGSSGFSFGGGTTSSGSTGTTTGN
jgi:hypothetical protein